MILRTKAKTDIDTENRRQNGHEDEQSQRQKGDRDKVKNESKEET